MKLIYQHDQRDCGAACLATVAGYYGLKIPISQCREVTKTDRDGTNLYGLVEGATLLGFECNALQGTPDELRVAISDGEIPFPFIAHVVSKASTLHFVVVYGERNGQYLIADPGKGKEKITHDQFFEQWTGYVVSLMPGDCFVKRNLRSESFKKFASLLTGEYTKLMTVCALSLVVAFAGVASAFLFQTVIDNFEYAHSEEAGEELDDVIVVEPEEDDNILETIAYWLDQGAQNFNVYFLIVLMLYLVSAIIQVIRGYLLILVSKHIDLKLALGFLNHLVGLPISAIAVRRTGEYLSRFYDTTTIRSAISTATLTLILDTTMAIGVGVVLALQNFEMFLVSLLIIVLNFAIVTIYRKPVERINRDVMESNSIVQSYLKESIDGIETVKASNAENDVRRKVDKEFRGFLDKVVKSDLIALSQETIVSTVELLGILFILWLGFSLVLAGRFTVGALITFYVLLGYFTEPVKNLVELQPEIQVAYVAADRLNDVLDLREEYNVSEKKLPRVSEWSIDGVDFRYGNNELTIHDFDLSVKRGERVAIVGESGCGKTTLAKLLLRFYEPEKGYIRADGESLTSFSLESLRSSVAYVNQETFLFADTIMNNLTLGCPDTPKEAVIKACEAAQIDEFINRLPLGYDTVIDENGSDLSGGQRQRLAIARALLKSPQLLILDEATSGLDAMTETAIKEAVFNLNQDLTCIIIAHRLATIKQCDRIYVMDYGKVVEVGSHYELMKADGYYKRLWEATKD